MIVQRDAHVREGLRELRRRRAVYFSILVAFLPACTLLSVLGFRYPLVPVLGVVPLFALAAVAYRTLNRSRCPRCHEHFFVQKLTKQSWTPYSSTSIPPQRTCQKCGLDLYEGGRDVRGAE